MAILCGGTPTPDDLAKVQEFQAALAQPTEHLTRLALVEMDESGAPEIADFLARHAAGCDQPECQKEAR
ncbi:hypothetical protein SEA_FUZZBUSTER_21 [Microbacterium phage FuzzBuster]|uniref:Uncharacterized protein n=1 Tax=Microbacterium phage FuzzBuster TaxID=2590935 RepID=A0A516KUZ4_9CAUD|nr:hypothetical protein SEA_FUZZBUSTER_21 [Microbacterium phage FuzzBuster]